MPRFVARPIVVEAHQVQSSGGGDLPEAFVAEARRRRMERGEWLLRDGDGVFTTLPAGRFDNLFEPTPTAAAPPQPAHHRPDAGRPRERTAR